MKIILKVAKIDKPIFNIEVDDKNFLFVRKLLEVERRKIIDKFRSYKSAGLIGSIFYPRNKYLQNELNDLVKRKRTITKSIETINEFFIKS